MKIALLFSFQIVSVSYWSSYTIHLKKKVDELNQFLIQIPILLLSVKEKVAGFGP